MSSDALFDAIREGDIARVQSLAAEDPSILDSVASTGHSVSRMAADKGQEAIRCWFADSLEPTDPFDMIALGRADLLHQLPVDRLAEITSFDGWTPLHLAAFYGRVGMVQWLVEHEADTTALSSNAMCNQPLHAALAGACCEQTVDLLLAAGAPVQSVVASGVTALHLAAARGHRVLVEKLLQAGADADARLASGQTAAELAGERGHADLAAWMTKH